MNTKSRTIIADLLEREMKSIENGIATHQKWIAYHKKYPGMTDQSPEEYEEWAMGCIARKQERLNDLYKAYQEL